MGNLKAAAYGAVPSDVLPGQTSRDGEDYAAALAGHITLDPLTLYSDCEGTIATVNGPKHKALGARGPEHTSGRGSWFPTTSGRPRSRVTRQRDGRTSHLCKRGSDFADTFAKKVADAHKLAFRVAKTVVACASLAKQAARWAAQAHVLLRFRGWDDTRAAAPRSRPPRARLKRKRRKEIAAPASGQVCDFLSSSPHASRKTVHLLCQMWSGLVGAGGRAVPQLQRIPRGQNITATQIEVGAVSKQTLPWLDSRARSQTHPG